MNSRGLDSQGQHDGELIATLRAGASMLSDFSGLGLNDLAVGKRQQALDVDMAGMDLELAHDVSSTISNSVLSAVLSR